MTRGAGLIPLAKPILGDEERAEVDRVLSSGMLAQGPEVEAFQSEFSRHVADRHAVAVNSGTSALHLAFLALGIGPGDEVLVPSFSFAASANAVVLAGAEPVFVDIAPETFTLNVDHAASLVTLRTSAIMPVHLYGHPAHMDAVTALARRHGLAIVEDAAQAHLASFGGVPVGAFGDAACFSFYPTKNMTTGEGGMVVTADAEVARRLRLLRNQGMEERYHNEVVGFNLRMTDLAAAIGRVQLRRLPRWTERRRRNAEELSARLSSVVTPTTLPEAEHVFHQYTIRSDRRDGLAEHLRSHGVGCGVYYPVPLHELPSFARTLELPATSRAAEEVLSLPVHPSLTDGDLSQIVEVVEAFA